MAFTQAEIADLTERLKEIGEEKYCSVLHELRKKLLVMSSQYQSINSKFDKYSGDIEQFTKCHSCHTLIIEKKNQATQTDEKDLLEQPAQIDNSLSKTADTTDIPSNSKATSKTRQSNGTPPRVNNLQPQASNNDMDDEEDEEDNPPTQAVQPKKEMALSPEPIAGPSGLNRPNDIECIFIDSD